MMSHCFWVLGDLDEDSWQKASSHNTNNQISRYLQPNPSDVIVYHVKLRLKMNFFRADIFALDYYSNQSYF